MDGDTKISISDFELFLGSMPNELALILEPSTDSEKPLILREYLIRMRLKKNIDTKKIINVRGNNYETINHQLPFVAKTIMSAFAGEENNYIETKAILKMWLEANTDFIEYWFDIIRPLAWLSQVTIEKHCFSNFSAESEPTAIQKAFQQIYRKNNIVFSNYQQKKTSSDEGAKRRRRCSLFCFGGKGKIIPETYLFERDYIKKGELLSVKDQKQRKCTLIYNYNTLYLQFNGYYESTNFSIVFAYN